MKKIQQNTKNKKVITATIDEVCEIFRDKEKLTDIEILDIITEYRGFDWIFDSFLEDITSIADNYHSNKKEQKEYINSLLNMIYDKIQKRKFNKCIDDINVKFLNLELNDKNVDLLNKILNMLK